MSALSPAQSGLMTDHSIVTFDLQTAIKAAPRIKWTVFDHGRGDFDGLRSTLVSDLSSTMDKKDDVNKSWSKWKSTFLAAVDRAIPKRHIKNVHSPPGINGEIILAIKKRETVK